MHVGMGTKEADLRDVRAEARVILVADEPIVGKGLKMVLENAGFGVIHVESLERASRMLGTRHGEVVVWSGEHADSDQLAEAQSIKQRHAEIAFCILAKTADPSGVEELLERDPNGLAFVPRTAGPQVSDLIDAVTALGARRPAMTPKLLMKIVQRAVGTSARLDSLTPCELEVLEYVAIGFRNCEIARRLWKSEKTVEKHVGRLFSKLGFDPETDRHLDRRVAATRVFLEEAHACRFVKSPHEVLPRRDAPRPRLTAAPPTGLTPA
jgi:DNA-binding NarL/FixJ family response regulator